MTLPAILVTWNPAKWEWSTGRAEAVRRTRRGESVANSWAVGRRTGGLHAGQRAFLLQQGAGDRGLIASGAVRDGQVFQADHWDGTARLANYAEFVWDVVLDEGDELPTAELEERLPHTHWRPQSSGTFVRAEDVEGLEALWEAHMADLA